MSDWDFLWDLKGEELLEAQATGATASDWAYIEEQDRIERKAKQEELKHHRDSGEISGEKFKK